MVNGWKDAELNRRLQYRIDRDRIAREKTFFGASWISQVGVEGERGSSQDDFTPDLKTSPRMLMC